MQVTGSGSIVKPESVAEPHTPPPEAAAHARDPAKPVDEVAMTALARMNLNVLTPPRDSVKLAQLQQEVFSGRYGPPAVTIAEALIAMAIARGLKI